MTNTGSRMAQNTTVRGLGATFVAATDDIIVTIVPSATQWVVIHRVDINNAAGTGNPRFDIASASTDIFEDNDLAFGVVDTTVVAFAPPIAGSLGETVVVTYASTTITAGTMQVTFSFSEK